MNRTKSGAIAVGAPGSKARMIEEAKHALKNDGARTLFLTQEGGDVLRLFDFMEPEYCNDVGSYDDAVTNFLLGFIAYWKMDSKLIEKTG